MREMTSGAEPASGSMSRAVVDELRHELDDDDLLVEILETFDRESSDKAEAIAKAAEISDTRALSTHAHALKGAAGTFGAAHLSRLCAELEQLDPAAPARLGTDLAGEIVHEHRRVLHALRSIRDELQ